MKLQLIFLVILLIHSISGESKCPENEKFKKCATTCPENCSGIKRVCRRICLEGCECKKGFVRKSHLDDKSPCIPTEKCPISK
jgi:hypothetical protein